MLLLCSGILLVWLALVVAVLGVCGLAADADARDERLAARARARARKPRVPRRARPRPGSTRAVPR